MMWRWMGRVLKGLSLLILGSVLAFAVNAGTAPMRRLHITSPPPSGEELDATDTSTAPVRVRLVIWNLAHGRGNTPRHFDGGSREVRRERLRAIADRLRDLRPDLVVLNEVDFDSFWSFGVNHARVLADAVGLPHRFEVRTHDAYLPGFRILMGNAVLSRFPLSEPAMVDHPAPVGWKRLAGHKRTGLVTARLPRARRLRVGAVHIDPRREALRVASVEALEAARRAGPSDFWLLAGDFNTTLFGFPWPRRWEPGDRTALDLLLATGHWHTEPTRDPTPDDLTFPADAPNRVIDWALVTRPARIVDRQVLTSTLSDHRPVRFDIEVP